jgi:hypothetical protein
MKTAARIDPDDAHACRTTLYNFRMKMGEAEEQETLTYGAPFDEIVRAIVKDKGILAVSRKVVAVSPGPLPHSRGSVQAARSQQHGGAHPTGVFYADGHPHQRAGATVTHPCRGC